MTNFLKQLPQHCVFLKINDFFILKLLMLGFETRTSGFGSDLSANCATPTAQYIYSLMRGSAICLESGVHYLGSIFNEAILVFVWLPTLILFWEIVTFPPTYLPTYLPMNLNTYVRTRKLLKIHFLVNPAVPRWMVFWSHATGYCRAHFLSLWRSAPLQKCISFIIIICLSQRYFKRRSLNSRNAVFCEWRLQVISQNAIFDGLH